MWTMLTPLPFNLRDLECLVAVADERHFGRAALQVAMTTSSLSKHVAKLEHSLGTRLFTRTSRQVELTPAGAVLVDAGRRVLSDADAFWQLARDAAEGRLGELIIAYSPGNGELVSRIIQFLRAANPNLRFRLEQQLSRDIGAAVRAGRVSLGICRAMAPPGLMKLTVSSVPRDHLAMPANHRLADQAEVTLADLAGETLLASELPEGATGRVQPAYLAELGISVRYEPWVTESHVMDSVAAGLGLTVLDRGFLERNPRPDVVACRLVSALTPDPVEDYLVWRPGDTSPVLHQFVSAARALFAPEPREAGSASGPAGANRP
jgi:DNA-binding transcriptional LysR family regulator